MISINNLSVFFGGFTLFDQVNFHINDDDRVGLVGRNGSGKTTLLKIIAGVSAPTSGLVSRPSEMTIGYLPQEMEYSKSTSVLEEAMLAFSSIKEIEREIADINIDITERSDYESDEYNKLLVKLNDLNDRLNLYCSGNPQADAERVLIGLGFKREEFSRKRLELSQGWNMRIELAKVLLGRPEILLLDEPTNHLDIESIRWLESYLLSFQGAILLISHDRRFLDSVTKRTVEIVLGRINDYKVPYSKYLDLRRERMEQQRAAYDNQQRVIEKSEEFIERFRYKATKSNQVQSRIKQLEKIERIEIEEEDRSRLFLKFPPAPRSGQVVVKSTNLSIAFGSKSIFSNVNITIERGEKVALLGKNGEGKTTFMRLITSDLKPTSGVIEMGHNVSLGYYAQNQEELLDKNDTVFDTLDKVATGEIRTKLRDILGAFLFRGEDVDKRVSVLSGGERSRLAMAKLILKPYNFLVLDEPTNHMDIRSKDILKQALQRYDGTLLLVSHDRDFLDGLADKIYEFKDGSVREHLGGLEEFLSRKRIDTLDELENLESGSFTVKTESQKVKQDKAESSERPQESYQRMKEIEREARRVRVKIEKCEERISSFEKRVGEIELILSGNHNSVSLPEILSEYEDCRLKLQSEMKEWERLHNEE
ncbi:MAG: ABC-F family ATP-binding cassette domain-containing protein [Bacteroidales bacterium]|nr:ABC-F family ATP-binding cassette domain-containing protein [Bacteroidales bacterium]